MITVVPPHHRVNISWLQHPVTWNSGTDTRLRSRVSPAVPVTRTRFSHVARKHEWASIAPFGKPVVPLV